MPTRSPNQTAGPSPPPGRWKWRLRETRMLCYLLVLAAVAAWKYLPRPWHPAITIETPHHSIASTATRAQTEDMAQKLGLLYDVYARRLGTLKGFQAEHPKLKVKLFKDRAEFRRINPSLGWAGV